MTSQNLTEMFRTVDTATLLELFMIIVGALLCITIGRKRLPWIAGHLHGQRRLVLLAKMVPLLRLLIIVAAFLLSVPLIIEPSLQNMVALLGSLGLALGFALKDYASSLIAGSVAVSERPCRNGDWIEVGGIYGEVTHVGRRTLQLNPEATTVHIPHRKIWNELIANASSGSPRLQGVADFYFEPHHDGRQVRQLLLDVALTSPSLLLDEPVSVTVQEQTMGHPLPAESLPHRRAPAVPVCQRSDDSRQRGTARSQPGLFRGISRCFAQIILSASPAMTRMTQRKVEVLLLQCVPFAIGTVTRSR